MTEQELKEIIKNAKKELTLLRAAVRPETSSIIPIKNRTGFCKIIEPLNLSQPNKAGDCKHTYVVVDKLEALPYEHVRIEGHEIKLDITKGCTRHIYRNTVNIKLLSEITDDPFSYSVQNALIKMVNLLPDSMGNKIAYMVIVNAAYLVEINKKQNKS